jgi:hypothetical protein
MSNELIPTETDASVAVLLYRSARIDDSSWKGGSRFATSAWCLNPGRMDARIYDQTISPGSLPPFCRAGGGAPGPGTHAQRQQQFVYAPWDARTYARDPENTIGVVMRVSKLFR